MINQQYGKIVNIASVCGVNSPLVGFAGYSAAKAGVCQLAKIAAMETSRYGINVNAIAPGLIVTTDGERALKGELGEDAKEGFEEMMKSYEKQTAIGRTGTPQDIANLTLFLVSDASSFITGQVISCDGGHLLGWEIGFGHRKLAACASPAKKEKTKNWPL
jgi:3-oxoacyl-[acyl-carrier protein] reductase